MITFYDFSVAAGTTYTIAVQDFALATSTGLNNYTSSTITGVTPTCAMVIGTAHNPANDPGETAGAGMSIGFITTTDRCVLMGAADNVADTNGARGLDSGAGLKMANAAASAVDVVADGALISGGISLNYSDAATTAWRGSFAAFTGATNATSDSRNLGTGTSAQTITTSFAADVVFFGLIGIGATTAVNTTTMMSFGVATSDGTQKCLTFLERGGQANSVPGMTLLSNRVGCQLNQVTLAADYHVTAGNFTATSFDLTCNASAASDFMTWMAIEWSGGVKVLDLSTPTSTGNQAITGVGFQPQFCLVVLSSLEAVDSFPGSTSVLQSGFSISMIGDENWAHAFRVNSGQATTDTASQSKDTAVIGALATDCDGLIASFVSWDSDGMTLNWSAVAANAKKGFMVFFE